MASEIKANKISPATGTAFTLGDSGDTFTLPSGATLAVASGATISNAGTASGFADAGKQVWAISTDVQTVTSQVVTKATFDTVTDPDGLFSSNTYTVPSDGLYWVWGVIQHRSVTVNQVRSADTYIYINGSSVSSQLWTGGYYSTYHPVYTSYLADLSTNDTIELYGKLYGGGTLYFEKRYLAVFRIK